MSCLVLGTSRSILSKFNSSRLLIQRSRSIISHIACLQPCYRNLNTEHHKLITVPNALTFLRIASIPVVAYYIVQNQLIPAAGLVVLAGLTDIADGYIARRFPSQQSVAGSYLDPFADKMFTSILAIALTYSELLPLSLLALFVSRDIFLIAGAMYMRYISLSTPRKFVNLVNPKEAVIEMKPINSSKINTAVQITSVVASLIAPVFGFANCTALQGLWLIAAGTTVYSGTGYALQVPAIYKEAVRLSMSKSHQSL